MFEFFIRRKDKSVKNLVEFLEEADEALIYAYETKHWSKLTNYVANGVILGVVEKLNSGQSTLYGIRAYRMRTWSIISRDANTFCIRKELRHQHVRLGRSIYVAIGEDKNEVWKVSNHFGKFVVDEIEEVA